MLTIVNIDKIKINNLKVAGEKWQLSELQTGRDIYQFVYRCYELNPTTIGTKILGREAIINLDRKNTMIDLGLGVNVYELKCLTNGKSRLVGIDELRAPGRLIGPMLRVIEGC